MITIAYFSWRLNEYDNHPVIKNFIHKLEGVDYLIALIADNRMFKIIDSFIESG